MSVQGPASRASRLSLADVPIRASQRYPEETAFVVSETGEEITAEEFNRKVNRTAHALRKAGLEKGDYLGLLAGNSVELLAVNLGALKIGAVTVMLNVQITADDVDYQCTDSEVDAVIAAAEFASKVESPFLARTDDVQLLATIGNTDDASFDEFIDGHATAEPDVPVEATDPAIVMYTSGTTSKPKGVVHTHQSYSWALTNVTIAADIRRYDTLSSMLPMFHAQQHLWALAALNLSATSVVHREFNAERLLADIESHDITYVNLMSSMYRRLFDSHDVSKYDTDSVRKCFYGMPMEMTLRERIVKTFGGDDEPELLMGFGQTEVPLTCTLKPEWQFEKEGNYVGESVPFVDVEIVDEEGAALPRGDLGEIVYRSPSVMKEYLNKPEQTAEGFRDGWRHSGDVGRIDEDGQLLLHDRKKDMIKTGGENVSTTNVENVIGDHPAVQECAVIGLPHDRWTEAVTAFVLPASTNTEARDGKRTSDSTSSAGVDVTSDDIIEFCRERLSGIETPKDVILVDDLPFTATGKVRKVDLREEYSDHYN